MTVKHECSGKAYDVTGWHRCFRNATVEHDGQWWCWQHDPERVKADKEKHQVNQEIKQKVLVNLWRRRAHNAKLAALVTPELPALLERLAEGAQMWSMEMSSDDIKQGHALAAKIREALETNSEERE